MTIHQNKNSHNEASTARFLAAARSTGIFQSISFQPQQQRSRPDEQLSWRSRKVKRKKIFLLSLSLAHLHDFCATQALCDGSELIYTTYLYRFDVVGEGRERVSESRKSV